MPKYKSLIDYYKAKWKGQKQRCKEQQKTIDELRKAIAFWKKECRDKHSRLGSTQNHIGLLRGRIIELEQQLVDTTRV